MVRFRKARRLPVIGGSHARVLALPRSCCRRCGCANFVFLFFSFIWFLLYSGLGPHCDGTPPDVDGIWLYSEKPTARCSGSRIDIQDDTHTQDSIFSFSSEREVRCDSSSATDFSSSIGFFSSCCYCMIYLFTSACLPLPMWLVAWGSQREPNRQQTAPIG